MEARRKKEYWEQKSMHSAKVISVFSKEGTLSTIKTRKQEPQPSVQLRIIEDVNPIAYGTT